MSPINLGPVGGVPAPQPRRNLTPKLDGKAELSADRDADGQEFYDEPAEHDPEPTPETTSEGSADRTDETPPARQQRRRKSFDPTGQRGSRLDVDV